MAQASTCFARDACLIAPDATVVHGREDICLVLVQLAALRTQVEVESSTVLEAGDVALVHQHWKIRLRPPGANPFVQLTDPTLVLRRTEREWKLTIAAPWGIR